MEAEHDSIAPSTRREKRANYYTPPAEIRAVNGVDVDRSDINWDRYEGTASALIGTGLVTADMFPGQPGRPRSAVYYRPENESRPTGEAQSWWFVPGYLVIGSSRGKFYLRVTVSKHETERRKQVAAERLRARRHATPQPSTGNDAIVFRPRWDARSASSKRPGDAAIALPVVTGSNVVDLEHRRRLQPEERCEVIGGPNIGKTVRIGEHTWTTPAGVRLYLCQGLGSLLSRWERSSDPDESPYLVHRPDAEIGERHLRRVRVHPGSAAT